MTRFGHHGLASSRLCKIAFILADGPSPFHYPTLRCGCPAHGI